MWRFKPIYKSKIWGGDRILKFKGWQSDNDKIGESWELSGVPGDESVICSPRDYGMTITELIGKYGADLMGEKNFERFGTKFPLLIKFIDAGDDLSIQVHPDDEYSEANGLGSGKNEMWYVLDADRDSRLLNGCRNPQDRKSFLKSLNSGEIREILRQLEVTPGDAYYIPAGRVHSIGKGTFLLEVQQASDSTFRIYDYNRTGEDGKQRQLNISEALDVINFDDTKGDRLRYMTIEHVPSVIIDTPFFTSKVLMLSDQMLRNYSEVDSFVALVCVGGKAILETRNHTMDINRGETVLLSALEKEVHITPSGEEEFIAVEVFIR